MGCWTDWQEDNRLILSPYVDWEWRLYDLLDDPVSRLDRFTIMPALSDLGAVDSKAFRINARSLSKQANPPWDVFPCPRSSANGEYQREDFLNELLGDKRPDWLEQQQLDVELKPDDIVVGIVDTDIGLGHSRFRNSDGSTRVLAAWQQGAPWLGSPTYLPFGQQLDAREINRLLEKHSGNSLAGQLDQNGFYTEIGLLAPYPETKLGPLAKRAAHGTHVLGLLAGADPDDVESAEFIKRVKLLVVNLPPPIFFGQGGAFLDYYISFGLDWIRETYENLVSKFDHGAPPLVTNISFGKLAGAGDLRQNFVNTARGVDNSRTEWIFMPAGNDNLERCHAEMDLKQDEQNVAWRIQPDDETSNFLEIWTEQEFSRKDLDAFEGRLPLLLDVVPPGCEKGEIGGALLHNVGRFNAIRRDLKDAEGRIYCEWVGARSKINADEDQTVYRLRYLICLTSDAQGLKAGNSAPAGRYIVRAKRNQEAYDALDNKDAKLTARFLIQTDSVTLPYRRLARRSYFEDMGYKRFDQNGRPADVVSMSNGEELDTGSIVRRRGTMNSYALNKAVEAIAGYRRSDGVPAIYSASGRKGLPDVLPKAALPSDDGYAHLGVLSDGAQDGSKVALRGTSFASASAARLMINALLDGTGTEALDVDTVLDAKRPSHQEKVAWRQLKGWSRFKVGDKGRIKGGANTRVPRL